MVGHLGNQEFYLVINKLVEFRFFFCLALDLSVDTSSTSQLIKFGRFYSKDNIIIEDF